MEASTAEMRTSSMSSKREKKAPPSWMLRVMEKNNGFNPCFFGEKTFTTTDKDPNQNQFLIDPELMEQDIVVTNLVNIDKEGNKKIKKENHDVVTMKIGRAYKGLPVTLYTMYGYKFKLVLTRWDSKSVILKGREWKFVPIFTNVQIGDHVEVWSFRKMEHESLNLFLVIGKAF